MSKLFVIGNGFDLAHELRTSYEDFKKYIVDEYLDGKYKEKVPDVEEISDVEEVSDEKKAIFILDIISLAEGEGKKWGNVESSLGELQYEYVLDPIYDTFEDGDGANEFSEAETIKYYASNISDALSPVKALFKEWIERSEITNTVVKPKFRDLIGENDKFLTFNYTETLEEIYKVNKERVCHIHGVIGSVNQPEEIFFGHGNIDNKFFEKYQVDYTGSEEIIRSLFESLKKDTSKALKNHRVFFDEIDEEITEVYTVGFSFSEVDLIYIKEVCKKLSDNVVWYFDDFYRPEEVEDFKKILKECGFKGTFV
ncbi:bacteriophage abortive infection AbiH family protein [Stomatobaculum longum]